MRIEAGEAWPKAIKDKTVFLGQGEHDVGVSLGKLSGVTFRATGDGVRLTSRKGQHGLRFQGARGNVFENIHFKDCGYNGVFAPLCAAFQFVECDFSGIPHTAILTANSPDIAVIRCRFWDLPDTLRPGKGGHGVYFSQSSDRCTIKDCLAWNCANSPFQINAEQIEGYKPKDPNRDAISYGCRVTGNRTWNCGQGGGADFNMIGLCHSLVTGNVVGYDEEDNLAGFHAGGISLWDNGMGKRYGSHDNEVRENRIGSRGGRYAIKVARNCDRNTVDANEVQWEGRGPALVFEAPVKGKNKLNGRALAANAR